MTVSLPQSMNELDLPAIGLICGFYSLSIIEKYFPHIKIINACQWREHSSGYRHGGKGYKWLTDKITHYVNNNYTVLVIPEDEEVMYPLDQRFTNVLNHFKDNKVHLVTQLSDFSIYRLAGIKCDILELPWMMVNDCICFHAVFNRQIITKHVNANYISFTGRIQDHKLKLLELLCNNGVGGYGLLTTMNKDDHADLPPFLRKYCTVNIIPPYVDYDSYQLNNTTHKLYTNDIVGFMEGGFYKINDIWVSSNVVNFLSIYKEYANVPLVVHSETTAGVFPMTEKSVWPILLGKLFLINGHQGVMNEIQRFYNIDIKLFANTDFDDLENNWSDSSNSTRIQCMIEDNKELITNATQIYNKLKPELDKASYSFAENLYNFYIKQLQSI